MTLSDENVKDLLQQSKTIAVVGLSNHPGTPAYDVASYQQSQGYHVIPVHPQPTHALGHTGVANLQDTDEPVDIVNVFASVQQPDDLAAQAKAKGAKAIWMQPGAINSALEQSARQAGLAVISGRCFKQEHQRLLGKAPL